jgi:polyphosphate kinase 2 (PPK2 family)
VLVERVEKFATEDEWMRAYHEINDFEEQLCDHGIVLAKYWLHISKDEQLRRFKERETIPWKRYKITPDDYRNRRKWNAYETAANEMIGRTVVGFTPGAARITHRTQRCPAGRSRPWVFGVMDAVVASE